MIALAYKQMPGATDEPTYAVKDESDLILLGFLAFLDPPKDTAAEALKRLHAPERGRQDPDRRQRDHHRLHLQGSGHAGRASPARLSNRGDERGGTGRSRQRDQRLCQAGPGPQGTHHPRAPEQGPCGGVHGRRHQRRPGPEGRRCGHLGGQRGGHRQGVIRYHPAGKQPAGTGAGRAGRPASVRQHRQVHQDGGQLQLRQHVQRRGGQRVPALPAHAADPGADQQPALRLLADHHPHRRGGCRLADQAAQVGRLARSCVSFCLSGRSARSSIT